MNLQNEIEELFDHKNGKINPDQIEKIFNQLKMQLNTGKARAAEKQGDQWVVNHWVKKGILLGFKIGVLKDVSIDDNFVYFDKHTYPLKSIKIEDKVRIVPGGSSIRDGCYIGKNITCKSENGCISVRRPRSEGFWNRLARCPLLSKTMCWWAGIAGFLRERLFKRALSLVQGPF